MRFARAGVFIGSFLVLVSLSGCSGRPSAGSLSVVEINSPAGRGSAEPNLAADADGRVFLSWIEKEGSGTPSVRFSRWSQGSWIEARTIVSDDGLFVNWADFPSVLPLADGRIVAHWLQKTGGAPYAYDVRVSISSDGGATWSAPESPHRDGLAAEHGFVSLVDLGDGRFATLWLDGRKMGMAEAGKERVAETQLMLAVHDGSSFGPERVLDPRVCDCCSTTAVGVPDGIFAAYRDRSAEEVRDISWVRDDLRSSTAPALVNADGWKIPGCPVNGPAACRKGPGIALAWYSEVEGRPSVFFALSTDEGRSFGPPHRIDAGNPLGRVDVEWLGEESAIVVWMERDAKDGARILARIVTTPAVSIGPEVVVARTGAGRSSGFPRLVRGREDLLVGWTDLGEPSRVRVARLEVR